MKTQIIHKDILNHTIELNDFVAFPLSNTLSIGQVVKFGSKMIIVQPLDKGSPRMYTYRKYSNETILVPKDEITFFLLKN
jgi:hypothetical protein